MFHKNNSFNNLVHYFINNIQPFKYYCMDAISNISVLINLLLIGMFIVFIVLSLVYVLGKILIYFSNIFHVKEASLDVEKEIENKINNLTNGKGRVLKITKLD